MFDLFHIWKARPKPRLYVRLHKVEENEKYYVMMFRDPKNFFQQVVILPKSASWEGMLDAWERMHEAFRDALLERRG